MATQKLPLIKPGSRVLIAGRTGSGKTTLANWLMQRGAQKWIIFNPKNTEGYKDLPDSVTLKKFDVDKLERELKRHRFINVAFSPQESHDDYMDACIEFLHDEYENVGLCADELYTLHHNGRQGEGLTAWLTRGRERRQSFIGLTQRPKWISRFLFSEADLIGSMALSLREDRERMVADTGREEFAQRLDNHEWLMYNVAHDSLAHWGAVPRRTLEA